MVTHILQEPGVLCTLPLPNEIFSILTQVTSSQHKDVPEVVWNGLDMALPTLTICIETELWEETRKREWDFRLDPCHFSSWLLFSVSLWLIRAEQTHFGTDNRIQSTAKISCITNPNLCYLHACWNEYSLFLALWLVLSRRVKGR